MSQLLGRKLAQLVVHRRHQRSAGLRIAGIDCLQKTRNVVHEG